MAGPQKTAITLESTTLLTMDTRAARSQAATSADVGLIQQRDANGEFKTHVGVHQKTRSRCCERKTKEPFALFIKEHANYRKTLTEDGLLATDGGWNTSH